MEQRFCYHCGSQLIPGGRFCRACGTPILSDHQEVPVPRPEPIVTEEILEDSSPTVFSLDSFPATEPEAEPVAEPVKAPTAVVLTLDSLMEVPVEVPPQPEVQKAPAPQVPKVQTAPQEMESVRHTAPTPVAVLAPVPTPTKGILVRRGAGRTVLAVLLCIVLFLWTFATLTLLNARLSTSGEQCTVTIESALRSVDLTQIPATDIVLDADEDMSMAQWLLEITREASPSRVNADEDDLQEFWEASGLIPFLTEQLSAYTNDIYQGNSRKDLSADDIEDFLWDERDNIEDILGQQLSSTTIHVISENLEESGVLDMLSTRALEEQQPVLFNLAIAALSWWMLSAMLLVLLLLVLLLGKINDSILRTCSDTGIVVMVASGIWGLAGLFALVLPGAFHSVFSFLSPADVILSALLQSFLIPTAAAFGTGVVLVLIRVLGKKIVLARTAKQA